MYHKNRFSRLASLITGVTLIAFLAVQSFGATKRADFMPDNYSVSVRVSNIAYLKAAFDKLPISECAEDSKFGELFGNCAGCKANNKTDKDCEAEKQFLK